MIIKMNQLSEAVLLAMYSLDELNEETTIEELVEALNSNPDNECFIEDELLENTPDKLQLEERAINYVKTTESQLIKFKEILTNSIPTAQKYKDLNDEWMIKQHKEQIRDYLNKYDQYSAMVNTILALIKYDNKYHIDLLGKLTELGRLIREIEGIINKENIRVV